MADVLNTLVHMAQGAAVAGLGLLFFHAVCNEIISWRR